MIFWIFLLCPLVEITSCWDADETQGHRGKLRLMLESRGVTAGVVGRGFRLGGGRALCPSLWEMIANTDRLWGGCG